MCHFLPIIIIFFAFVPAINRIIQCHATRDSIMMELHPDKSKDCYYLYGFFLFHSYIYV